MKLEPENGRFLMNAADQIAELRPASRVLFLDPEHGPVLDARFAGMRAPWFDALNLTNFTIEVWAKPKLAGEWLVVCQPLDSKDPWVLAVGTDGDLALLCPGNRKATYWTAATVNDDRWHHLAATIDGDTVHLFVDGRPTKVLSRSEKAPRTIPWSPGLHIGSFKEQPGVASTNSEGLIRSVRVSRGVRHIAAGEPALDEATIGLWSFDHVVDARLVPNQAGLGGNGELVAELPCELVSLDELDRRSYDTGPSPLDGEFHEVELRAGYVTTPNMPTADVLSLDGAWDMVEGGDEAARISDTWSGTIPATVPGSVHGALEQAGKIPDPKHGRNDGIANAQSFQSWWFRKRFARPPGTAHRLVFDGVAIHCSFWLNGTKLGEHEGMFGGPSFDVSQLLRDQNELLVKIDPAPKDIAANFRKDNHGWKQTVVFNNVYGWHYSNIPALGIWRSVRVESAPTVKLISPFVATESSAEGLVKLVVDLKGPDAGWSGRLSATLEPENFQGQPASFELELKSSGADHRERVRLRIPNVKLWWPNGYGDPCLYKLMLQFTPDGPQAVADRSDVTFGVRTIEMVPLPPGISRRLYNWTFVINGRPMFIKGTGWCTMDSSMDFSRQRYQRFLQLAKDENCQMVRAWGSGMPETDDFYDVCDRLGLTVMQEWPTAWNSHDVQPYDALEETVRLNTLRLRNHPSLVIWGGGNESSQPFGPAIDMMGRYSVELDGSRPFHRGQPWGGSRHSYACWWGKSHLDFNLNMVAPFFGEFGIASVPVYESVQRYLPADEQDVWPPPPGGSFEYHTPVFNLAEDMNRLRQYAGYFTEGQTMRRFITGSQLAQSVAARHPLERARTRWPDCTGALLYKLNDNYPAASWATIDWYGAPKISHWFVQDAFMPVTAVVLFESVNMAGKPLALPVWLLDDTGRLQTDWRVRVRAYGADLNLVHEQAFTGRGAVEQGRRQLGPFQLTAEQSNTTPLLVTTEVLHTGGQRISDTFYFINYESKQDCLFELPRTTLSYEVRTETVIVTNTGTLPAVGVSVHDTANLNCFTADDNYFWLNSGESRSVMVSSTKQLRVEAWNA